jgi:hypothetical protein
MSVERIDNKLIATLAQIILQGIENSDRTELLKYRESVSGQEELTQAMDQFEKVDLEEASIPVLDLATMISRQQQTAITLPSIDNVELEEIESTDGDWQTPMPIEDLYAFVPETRPFAKRAKPVRQVELIELAKKQGQLADLRLVPIFIKRLGDKEGDIVGDAIANIAFPAFGPTVLNDLWPSLTPDSRAFIAAYQIDVEATLSKLIEKSGRKVADKSQQLMKAIELLLENVHDEDEKVSVKSLPILRLGLKYAPDANMRRAIADMIVSLGDAAKDTLPDLVDAFERGGIRRDHNLINCLMMMGKDTQEVADALTRALDDTDTTVRLMAAFNLAQMGSIAFHAIPTLERLEKLELDAKVRTQLEKSRDRLVKKRDLSLQPA